ncbi:hypothetical protein Drorol1_Dr00004304 [Drosera rotundifolia]
MVIAKGKGKADASKEKARKVTSPTNVQRADAANTPIKTITEIETPQPVTTETSCEESVGVSGYNAEGEHLSEGMEEENEEAEEMLYGEEKKLNVEENDDADLVNSDGSGGALGMVLEKADITLVGSGNALNTKVDVLIKEYIKDVLYKEKDPSKSGETTDVIEPNTDASLLVCDMKGEDVTRNSTNITGEAKGTALVQAGGVSKNKKVMKVKKIIKKKTVMQKRRVAPEGEAEPQYLDENKPDDVLKDSSSSAKVNQEEKVEAGHVASMLVPGSDTKEENVTLHPTINGGEAKGTATSLVGEGSVNEKVSKPKKILKKKAIVWRRKVIAGNEGEAQPLDANKSKDEVEGSSPRAKVNKEEKSEARHSDVVSISKKAGTKKKKVQGPTEKGTEKGGDKSEKYGSDQPRAEVNANEVRPVDAKVNKKEKCEVGLENPRKRDITETDKTEVNTNSAKGKDKAETSNKKLEAKAKNKGMIFMCSSKTKPDCYRYKVLGLPASKKDVVSKIYKGMRLFLFDVDLRLLYGIYEAAGPGGYSLEPKAFKSDFPSQVRFTVLEDCLPVAEEKFKKVIKDNYYARNKFGCELSSEQVKNLCKLFQAGSKGEGKGIKPQKARGRDRVPPASSSRKRDRSRRRIEDEPGHHHVDQDKGYKRRAKDIDHERRARDNGYDRRGRDNGYEKLARDIGNERRARDEGMHDMHHDWHPLTHERREAFLPVVAAPVPVPQLTQALPPPRGLQYVYGDTPLPDAYLRDVAYERRDYGPPVPLDAYRHDRSRPGLEARGFRDELELRGPYDAHREPRAFLIPVHHGTAAVQDPYDHPPAEHRPRVGRPGVYHDVDPMYRRY